MAIFAAAVATIVGDEAGSLTSSMGSFGALMDGLRKDMGQEQFFLVLVGLAILGQLFRSGFQYAGVVSTAVLQTKVTRDLQFRTLEKIFSLSYPEMSTYPAGALQTYVGHAARAGSLISVFNRILCDLFLILSYVWILLWLSWQFSIGAAMMVALFSLIITLVIKPLRSLGERSVKAGVKLGKRMLGFLTASKLVQVFGREQYALEKIGQTINEGLEVRKKGMFLKGAITPIIESLTIISGGMFLIGGYYWLQSSDSNMTLAGLLAYLYIMIRLMAKVSSINGNRGTISNTLPAAEIVAKLFHKSERKYKRLGGVNVDRLSKSVEYRNVSFSYQHSSEAAVNDVSLTINAGSVVALVGASGAGKSTIVDLLLGLYDPSSGTILVDNIDLSTVDLAAWRECIGVVDQDVFLLNASVRDNIAFGKLNATQNEVVDAARAAHADDFISLLPKGYDTPLGDRGYGLSGGQKQRLAIARALIRNPDLLILDEATSALDSESERLIQRTVRELSGGCTVLIIAHRLSTLIFADQIIVLDSGSIIEKGTHMTLLKNDGIYANLWHMQSDSRQRKKLGVG